MAAHAMQVPPMPRNIELPVSLSSQKLVLALQLTLLVLARHLNLHYGLCESYSDVRPEGLLSTFSEYFAVHVYLLYLRFFPLLLVNIHSSFFLVF